MTIDKNDPRLTAFALGELAAEEAGEVEAAVEKDAALRGEVASIREMAEKLKKTLAEEPLPKAEPVRTLESEKKQNRLLRRLALYGSGVAVLLVIAALITVAGTTASKMAARIETDNAATGWEAAASVESSRLTADDNLRYARPQYETIADASYSGEKKDKYIVAKEVTERMPAPVQIAGETSPTKPSTDQFSVGVPIKSKESMSRVAGRPTESPAAPAKMMMVTPRIIVAEEEEENLGIIPELSARQTTAPFNTESYDKITENEFQRVAEHPLSTFSIDVDTASYSMVRRMLLEQARMPAPGAVRLEEMINYFDYEYEPPTDERPFATHVDAARCPWNDKHNLVRIGLKGRVIDKRERDAANLVFLLDVSGSMDEPNKLPLLKDAMRMLVENLNEKDRVAIVVYAGASGMVLPSTGCGDKQKILDSLERLQAGGSTNGGAGIALAYATAAANYIKGGVNRVILCTDGDFNVGTTNQSELIDTIEKKAKEGVFLSVLGFGMGNYKDSTLEKLADKGNGNYGYIDTPGEARKLLVEGLCGTLVTIAKDVKIQVEFNPAQVKGYRLLGYENRMLKKEDFNDDSKDAGEIGAGHTVTALYETIPADSAEEIGTPKVDELKYQKPSAAADDASSQEMLTVKLRYKEPDGEKSKLLSFPVKNEIAAFDKAGDDLRFASSVTAFGMLLRGSAFKGDADYDKVLAWAEVSLGKDEFGYRKEFLKMVRAAKSLNNK